MADVTTVSYDEMETLFDGLIARARAALGVSSFGLQLMSLPPSWEGYPAHCHEASAEHPPQEEVYIPLDGSATMVCDESEIDLRPGMMVRVGPDQLRRILPGPEGLRFIAIGGVPESFDAHAWTENGGPSPV